VWQRLKLVQGCGKAKENAITTLRACLLPKMCRILYHLMHCILYTLKKYEFYYCNIFYVKFLIIQF